MRADIERIVGYHFLILELRHINTARAFCCRLQSTQIHYIPSRHSMYHQTFLQDLLLKTKDLVHLIMMFSKPIIDLQQNDGFDRSSPGG